MSATLASSPTDSAERFQVDQLSVRLCVDRPTLAREAARMAHDHLAETLRRQGHAAVILATGNSQIQFLDELVKLGGIDWSVVTLFHMDEYLGISANHAASFRRYMREKVESRVRPKAFHYLAGDAAQPIQECERYSGLLGAQPIDLCCMGVGENGHIAFNDPPVADLNDPLRVKIVQLDHECRMQQVGEGHFPSLEAVPQYALTLTITALCSARRIICICPETRKAKAVKAMLEGPIGAACPASALRRQPQATLLLDPESASLLS
ncbi:MAG: glucosamine-6-phosphate deaminase [Verrucomicrobia bacterium]|nr:glucosamine-6-phosphate deaminase [Verrucomicrobiota bacterium]MBI3869972.1 glucosamine-6-phosphate deaminase [Verrucomicrobiota bacterium]